MSFVTSVHNDWLLWVIQEGLYAHPVLATLVLGVLLFGLPAHRPVVWWTVVAPVNSFCCLTLLFYGAPTAVPGLACVMAGMLSWQAVRAVLWRGTAVESWSRLPWWCSFPSWPARWLAASYIRVDPRAMYWIDLARAERGLAHLRGREDRRGAVLAGQASGLWRNVWRLWLLVVEARIFVWQRLPAFYHLGQTTMDLAEPHLIEALQQACQRESHNAIASWTAGSLNAYCGRSEREHAAAMQLAAACGRRWMLHREALAEIMTAGPWTAGDPGLASAARFVYATGQLRRQYDHLWHETLDFTQLAAGAADAVQPAFASRALEDSSTGRMNGDEESHAENDQRAMNGPVQNGAVPRESILEAIRQRFGGEESRENGDPHRADEQADESVTDDSLFGGKEDQDSHGNVEPDEGNSLQQDFERPLRDRERLGDLQLGKRLLAAFLAIDLSRIEIKPALLDECFKQPESRAAVLLLVAFMCLEEKHHHQRRGGGHGDLLAHWVTKVEQLAKRAYQQRQLEKAAKGGARAEEEILLREFYQHYHLDVLYERQAFLRIRELLGSELMLLPHQARLLADAETELARRLAGQPQFQTMLRLDAIDHYFQARFPGVWTIEIAQHLVEGIRDRQDLQVRLGTNKVELKGGGRMEVDEAGAPTKARRSARLSDEGLKHALQAERQTRVEVEIENHGSQVWNIPFFIGGDAECHWRLNGAPRVELRELNDQIWILCSRATPDVSVEIRQTGKTLNPTQARFQPGDILRIGKSIAIRLMRVEKS